VDRILIPLSGLVTASALITWIFAASIKRSSNSWGRWGESLGNDPVFGASVLAVVGYIVFMTWQNHPQPRYFAVVAVFCFLLIARGAASLLDGSGLQRRLGWAVVAIAASAAVVNAAWTLSYAAHPEYTYVSAARELTRYIDLHPNGKRLLVSISGDEITLATHLPTLCDDFGTEPLAAKLAYYQPGWYAAWNDLDPGTLADLHTHYSLEQVASFHAFDDPERNVLVLFKLHPLPNGRVRDQHDENLRIPLAGDTIAIPAD
jgi:hypothetical protein